MTTVLRFGLLLCHIPQETVGEPFFLLLCAIKQQINKGSIDAITGKARYTLNEEWLLRENVEAKPQVWYLTRSLLIFPMLSFAFYIFSRQSQTSPPQSPSQADVKILSFFFCIADFFIVAVLVYFAEYQRVLPGLWHGLTICQGHAYRHNLPGEGKNHRGLL